MQDLQLADVSLERLLLADRDALDGELEGARVDAARSVAQHRADLAGQESGELGVLERGQPPDRLDPGTREPDLRLGSDARELAHGERRQICGLAAGGDDGDAARLARVARHLGHDLARGDAERAREARRAADGRLHGVRDAPGCQEVTRDLADLEVALVEARPLDGGHDIAHGRPYGLRVLAVEGVPGPNEDGVRAAADRLGATHRGVDAEAPRRVVRGRHDAAPARIAADDERLRAEGRILELLDGGEERVQIEVRDDHRRSIGPSPERPARRGRRRPGPAPSRGRAPFAGARPLNNRL